jgi:hypothetical protein
MQLELWFASWALWSFATSFCVLVASVWAVSPVVRLVRNDCKPVPYPYSYIMVLLPCAAVLLPVCVLWWLAVDDTSSRSISILVKAWRKLPFWNSILWCKSPMRTLKLIGFVIASAACGTVCINWTVGNPLVCSSSEKVAVSYLMTAPFGLIGAICVLHMELSTPRYPVAYQSRFHQLQGQFIPTVAAAILSWVTAVTISLSVYLLTPVPLVPFLDCITAFAAGFGYTLSLILTGTLTSIILAERPSLTHLGDFEGSMVRVLPAVPNNLTAWIV